MSKLVFEKKFGNKMYRVVYVEWGSSHAGYGGEPATKAAANKKADKIREYGFSARVNREMHVKDPRRGLELFYVIYARKDGLTLDQVESFGKKLFCGL